MIAILKIITAIGLLTFCFSSTSSAETIRCASTTSTQNSGFFEYILPLFEQDTSIKVHVIAVGTGAALALGKHGDVDVVIVHDKDSELKLVQNGFFIGRHDFMFNDFVIIGPQTDPAEVSGQKTAVEVMKIIYSKKAAFVSRGDDSGTHRKEMNIWKNASLTPDAKLDKWYMSVGQGMSKTIRIAAEKDAYTITDRGTWLAMKDKENLSLKILFEGDPSLFNQYGVMAVNPVKHKHAKFALAAKFIRWLTSVKGQKAIGNFENSHGNSLFIPNAQQEG